MNGIRRSGSWPWCWRPVALPTPVVWVEGIRELGVAMASTNRDAVLRGLAAYRWSLEQLEDAVLQQNWSQLELELRRTQTLRPDFLRTLGEVSSEN